MKLTGEEYRGELLYSFSPHLIMTFTVNSEVLIKVLTSDDPCAASRSELACKQLLWALLQMVLNGCTFEVGLTPRLVGTMERELFTPCWMEAIDFFAISLMVTVLTLHIFVITPVAQVIFGLPQGTCPQAASTFIRTLDFNITNLSGYKTIRCRCKVSSASRTIVRYFINTISTEQMTARCLQWSI